jgi:hypothetical protein
MSKKTKTYWVLLGDPAENEWADNKPIGPFSSIEQAKKAIRKDSLAWLEGREHQLGGFEDWTSTYYIVEVTAAIKPCIWITASATLKDVSK